MLPISETGQCTVCGAQAIQKEAPAPTPTGSEGAEDFLKNILMWGGDSGQGLPESNEETSDGSSQNGGDLFKELEDELKLNIVLEEGDESTCIERPST